LPGCGRIAVTPVRTRSPSTIVVWPTRTPSTSVIALCAPLGRMPTMMPRSRARGRVAQRLAGDVDVVERKLASGFELLSLLVALARDDDDVARPGELDGALDRRAPVDDGLDAGAVADPLEDLRDDRLWILGARIVGRDDHRVGQARGDLPHQRPLAAITVAAAAERADDAGVRQLAGGAQDVVQRVRRVRVVDDDGEGLAFVDRLEAAGDAAGLRHGAHDRLLGDTQAAGDCDGAQDVEDVEAAGQRRAQLELAVRRVDREGRSREAALQAAGPVRGAGVDGDRHGVGELCRQSRAIRVVHVGDGHSGPGLPEPALGREVGFHRVVEVQVILGQVGEDRRRPVDGVGAVQVEGVRADFHRAGLVPRRQHRREVCLQVDRLGCRAPGLALLPADHGRHGSQQPGAAALGLQESPQEVCAGGLAVGAGDADDRERRRRIGVKAGRRRSHRGTRIGHDDLRHA